MAQHIEGNKTTANEFKEIYFNFTVNSTLPAMADLNLRRGSQQLFLTRKLSAVGMLPLKSAAISRSYFEEDSLNLRQELWRN